MCGIKVVLDFEFIPWSRCSWNLAHWQSKLGSMNYFYETIKWTHWKLETLDKDYNKIALHVLVGYISKKLSALIVTKSLMVTKSWSFRKGILRICHFDVVPMGGYRIYYKEKNISHKSLSPSQIHANSWSNFGWKVYEPSFAFACLRTVVI